MCVSRLEGLQKILSASRVAESKSTRTLERAALERAGERLLSGQCHRGRCSRRLDDIGFDRAERLVRGGVGLQAALDATMLALETGGRHSSHDEMERRG